MPVVGAKKFVLSAYKIVVFFLKIFYNYLF
ncbi:MAG: hypothetical protein UU95_C0010G0008 [Parcubacteria group bacterium GW2011_GWC2_42_12]|nr:MAG: hypothetical protein UU95_C0010G0008 [Parcubacteria group bacterium GW2011_GWC2_42_12]